MKIVTQADDGCGLLRNTVQFIQEVVRTIRAIDVILMKQLKGDITSNLYLKRILNIILESFLAGISLG